MSSASPAPDRQAILDAERAVNEQYIDEIERLLKAQPDLIKQISVMQSQQWTTSDLPKPGIDHGRDLGRDRPRRLGGGPPVLRCHGSNVLRRRLAGRKGRIRNRELGRPIASLFFEGKSAKFEIASSVLGRRTFVLRLDDLVDFQDEVEASGASPFEVAARTLDIPSAPTRRKRSAEPAPADAPSPGDEDAPTEPDVEAEDLPLETVVAEIAPQLRSCSSAPASQGWRCGGKGHGDAKAGPYGRRAPDDAT